MTEVVADDYSDLDADDSEEAFEEDHSVSAKDTLDPHHDDIDDLLQRWASGPGEEVPPVVDNVLVTILNRLEKLWSPSHEMPRAHFHSWLYERFRLDENQSPDPMLVQKRYEHNLFQVMRLYMSFLSRELFDTTNANNHCMLKFAKILEILKCSRDNLIHEHRIRALIAGMDNASMPQEVALFSFKFIDYSSNTPLQNFLLYLLNKAHMYGYRRYRGRCHIQRVVTIAGRRYPTRSWQYKCSIPEFVYDIDKESNFDQWKNLTAKKGNVDAAVEYLTNCQDIEFPELKVDRNLFAFRNGLYHTIENTFYPYQDTGVLDADPSMKNVCACKYHNVNFDPYWLTYEDRTNEDGSPMDWYDGIPTPHLQGIMNDQDWSEEVCRWYYRFLGRMLYSLGKFDQWQVIPFLKGLAGTGKSTHLKVAKMMYDATDVAVMSNNMEKKFGLSAIYDKFMFLCYEVKKNFALEQSEFQSIVSGEETSIAIKHKNAFTTEWTVPGMLAGNEVAGWVDAGGSITRRLVVFSFPNRVENGDPHLLKHLQGEIAAIITKANCAYLDAVSKWQNVEIWNVLPSSFMELRDELKTSISPLHAFITNSEIVELKVNGYMPWTLFSELYIDWARSNGYRNVRLEKDQYTGVFMDFALRRIRDTRSWVADEYTGRAEDKDIMWIVGLQLKRDSLTRVQGHAQRGTSNPVTQQAPAGGIDVFGD